MPRFPLTTPEDELEPLPPLDGEATDPDEPEAEGDVGDRIAPSATGVDPLDDSTAENDPVDAGELDDMEGGGTWLDDAADSSDLDVGENQQIDLETDSADADDDEAPGQSSEDLGLDVGGGDGAALADAGDEGPLDPDDELRDEDLPSLDADEEGEGDDATFWEGRLGTDELAAVAWADAPWDRVGSPLPLVQARAVVCVSRGALAIARSDDIPGMLVRVDLEGSVRPLAAAAFEAVGLRRLSAEGVVAALVTEQGQLYVGEPDAGRFVAAASGVPVADAILSRSGLWVRTSSGALLMSLDGGGSLSRAPGPGAVAAVARDGAGLAALWTDGGRQPTAILRQRVDGALERQELGDVDRTSFGPVGAGGLFAARAGAFAYVARGGRLVRRTAAGEWTSSGSDGKITALAFIDDGGTLVAATYSDADESSALIRFDARGRASMVARLGAAPDHPDHDGAVAAIACDDSLGVVWVAGGFGVVAFALT
jgi:hypothetical protein